jgi:hypothetical protein
VQPADANGKAEYAARTPEFHRPGNTDPLSSLEVAGSAVIREVFQRGVKILCRMDQTACAPELP